MGWPDKLEHVFTNHSKHFDIQGGAEDRRQTILDICIGSLFLLYERAKSAEQTLREFGCSSREEFRLEMLLFVNYPLMCSKVDIAKRWFTA